MVLPFGTTRAEALSPLPARLSLRASSPTPVATHTPRTSISIAPVPVPVPVERYDYDGPSAGGVSEWGVGGYAGLLARDPRRTTTFSTAHMQGADGRRRDSRVALLDGARAGGVAIVGSDAQLLLHEIDRQRSSAVQRTHRRLALWAGLLTLLATAFSFFVVVEAVWAIVDKGGKGRGAVRWVELGVGLACIAACGVVVAWLKTRRPSTLSGYALACGLATVGLHLGLAVANVALVLSWQDSLKRRCTWGIDVAWNLSASGDECYDGTSIIGWSAAASLRVVVTIVFGAIWLTSMRVFHRSLRISSIVDPNLSPSAEARTILASGLATFVPTPASARPTSSSTPDALPSMPIRGAHYAHPSDSTTIYATSDWTSARSLHEDSGGLGSWAAAQLWRGVGWMFGVEPYSPQSSSSPEEKGEKEAMLLRSGRGSEGMPGQRMSGVPDGARSEDSGRVYAPRDLDGEDPVEAQSFEELFRDVGNWIPGRSRREDQSPPPSPEHARGLSPRPVSRAQPSRDFSSLASTVSSPQSVLPPPPPPPPKPQLNHHHARRSSTGSSGSTGGSLVFVRMSDGRLVRKLSTIASESSESGGRPSSSRRPASSMWGREESVLEHDSEVIEVDEVVGGWRSMLPGGWAHHEGMGES